ncbi:MAG: diaminopimelate decarboxylase [Clostridiales bacterium]|jgi:diaminopimelate decarboxylase|nr:diaminopimelate decarboxylase [Clostridiales bacterium]
MIKLNGGVTDKTGFFNAADPFELTEEYGSPLYVYNERILRQNCRELVGMCGYPKFKVNFSAKANSNPALMRIIREEGLLVDAMSEGEIFAELAAGFTADSILFIPNNISEKEMRFACEHGILISVDSISQLEQYASLNPMSRVAVRFNSGVGTGHHEKVITAGKNVKFGVSPENIQDVKDIIRRYNLSLAGINQHIGSLFLEKTQYLKSIDALFDIARQFDDLDFIDLGGGFGIPYHKMEGQGRLDLKDLGDSLAEKMTRFAVEYGKGLTLTVEPGRYVTAEAGLLLGAVHAVKYNGSAKYVGTDIGFNVLARPVLYDAHHDIEIYRRDNLISGKQECVNITGNICESGDILAKNRLLPEIFEGDLLGVLDAGAYGHVMSSNYNNRLRPAEILLREDKSIQLIRRRDTLEDLLRPFIML